MNGFPPLHFGEGDMADEESTLHSPWLQLNTQLQFIQAVWPTPETMRSKPD